MMLNTSPPVALNDIHVVQFRVARPTHRLEALTRFYRDGLGLPLIGSFTDHDGYDGVMLGLPGSTYHLEFTQNLGMPAPPPPTGEHLLVLYITDDTEREAMYQRLEKAGAILHTPENPYWMDKSRTYADPDGWRIVICSITGV